MCNHNYARKLAFNKCQAAKEHYGIEHVAESRAPQSLPMLPTPTGGRPGDWSCPECNNHNYASKLACNRCQEPKPVPVVPNENGKSEIRPGDWNCTTCGNHNYSRNADCKKCGLTKTLDAPTQRMPSASYGATVPHSAQPGRQGPYGSVSRAPPQVAASPAGGKWFCQGCGHQHDCSELHCVKCGGPRLGVADTAAVPVAVPAAAPPVAQVMGGRQMHGDWSCQSCGNHNYRHRDACNKCQMPRDQVGEPVSHGLGGAPAQPNKAMRPGD